MNDGTLKQEHTVGLEGKRGRHGEVVHRGLDYVGVVRIVDDGDDSAVTRRFGNELHYGPRRMERLEACNLFLRPDEPVGVVGYS